jgi:hypothetical protein
MNPQLVSILFPAFTAERWIGECIESALYSDGPGRKLLLWMSARIVTSFPSREAKAVTRENRGASAARNPALSLAQGGLHTTARLG